MPRRAQRRAFGSVTEVVPGKKYVVRWVQNTDEGRVRKSKTIRGTRREANRFLAEMELSHGGERRVPTVGEAYRTWYLPWLEGRVAEGRTSERTARAYRDAWRLHVAPKWEPTPLDSIAPLDVQRWLSGMKAGPAKNALIVARAVVDFAIRYEVVGTNKFRVRYEMPTGRESGRSRDTFDLATAAEVLSTLRGMPEEPCFILSCFGSCRTGEACAPRVEDVGESGGFAVVRIDKQMPLTGTSPAHKLKNAQSERDVLIPPPFSARLLEIAEERRDAGSGWLCDRGDGLPLDKSALHRLWRQRAGDRHIPFGNLRNSWRTFAQYEWGVDYDTCELLMGHALPGVTGRHYLRPSTEQLRDKFEEALRATGHLPS